MSSFQHPLWGYEFTYQVDWVHRSVQDADGFAAIPEALEPDYQGPSSGQLLVRAEWNCARQPIGPLWSRLIGLTAGMLGAKQVGSAPWRVGSAVGLEAEMMLPKKENRRLWTGILEQDFTVLHFMVMHPLDERLSFEPFATQIISSLRFADHTLGASTSPEDLPLPPGYVLTEPTRLVPDIADPDRWRAYEGESQVGALQAFYLREAPNFGWQVAEYVPFPSSADLGFARLHLLKGKKSAMLGIMPVAEGTVTSSSPGKLVVKFSE